MAVLHLHGMKQREKYKIVLPRPGGLIDSVAFEDILYYKRNFSRLASSQYSMTSQESH